MIEAIAVCWLAFTGTQDRPLYIRANDIQMVSVLSDSESFLYLQGKEERVWVNHSSDEVFIMMREDCEGMD